MQLTIVGCSGSMPGPASCASSYLVEHDGFRLVLDLGNGAAGAVQRYVAPERIDAFHISHLHADHCLDLGVMSYAYKYGGARLERPIPVHAPPGAAERLARTHEVPNPGAFDGIFTFHDVSAGTWRLGPFEVTTAVVRHPVLCHAIRLEADGRSLVFSGDTGPDDALPELARGADLLLCEAAFPGAVNPAPDLHLTGFEAGDVAARAGVGRLVLTHVPPWVDPDTVLAEVDDAYDGPAVLAVPGAVHVV